MDWEPLYCQAEPALRQVVGYLNFSSGSTDPQFLRSMDHLFRLVREHARCPGKKGKCSSRQAKERQDSASWQLVRQLVEYALARLPSTCESFNNLEQAQAVWSFVFDHLLPGYRRFHRDLLFHQSDEQLFQPFFLARACKRVLELDDGWRTPGEQTLDEVLRRLNDYVGYRPVAVLENERKLQPYEHEWICPIPLYIDGAGVADGPYREVVERALEILRQTDPDLLRRAWFDIDLLEELALDPRAYDFEHPNHRRPNHQFGGWDPNRIDNRGFYRRFVVQQLTLDCLTERIEQRSDLPQEEVLFEAGAVLAGTILMGGGMTGFGPGCHDSSTDLRKLLQVVADYRDEFYSQLMDKLPAAHSRRLAEEAKQLRQPFGGARQDFNRRLLGRRAEQLQLRHLALLFARMGYSEEAAEQLARVPVASARIWCEIYCRLTEARRHLENGRFDSIETLIAEIEDLLHRGIECGAVVDPWNILGFGGQFSLFPTPDASIHDHRIDELITLLNDLFTLYARAEKEAAAAGHMALVRSLDLRCEQLAQWWDQFASTEVSEVPGFSGQQCCLSARNVADAICAWKQAGTAAGDLAFWSRHVEQFHSPRAFALAVETLLDHGDLVAAMALLMVWLNCAERIKLTEGPHSFHMLAMRWMNLVWDDHARPAAGGTEQQQGLVDAASRWPLTRKFFDYLEANAEQLWDVPQFELRSQVLHAGERHEPVEEEDSEESLFRAAYENMVFRDSAADGFEGEMLDGLAPVSDVELAAEAERLVEHIGLQFLIARLWQQVAAALLRTGSDENHRETLSAWLREAERKAEGLNALMASVHAYRIPPPRHTIESMIEFEQRRTIKEGLLDRIIAARVSMDDAVRAIRMALKPLPSGKLPMSLQTCVEEVLCCLINNKRARFRRIWPGLLMGVEMETMVYVPIHHGGNPAQVAAVQSLHSMLHWLLEALPRFGYLQETVELLEMIQEAEEEHRAGARTVTSFDEMFEVGCKAVTRCIATSAEHWRRTRRGRQSRENAEHDLIDCLESVADELMPIWLDHSASTRISAMESAMEPRQWNRLKRFIRRYGGELFTQHFLSYGNLRAMVSRGADAFLASLLQSPDEEDVPGKLVADLQSERISRREAATWLNLIAEAVLERYAEYVDYNSSTTQSDRGNMLWMFLDFLRLRAAYDRAAWNLTPIALLHRVLVDLGHHEAAAHWQNEVAARTRPLADHFRKTYADLCRRYGMQLVSVADRINERFVRTLQVDRLRGLVGPAMQQKRSGQPPEAFQRLQRELAPFLSEGGGAGFEMPEWLETLVEQVEQAERPAVRESFVEELFSQLPEAQLSLRKILEQFSD